MRGSFGSTRPAQRATTALVLVALALGAATTTHLSAQSRRGGGDSGQRETPARPYRGLFGSGANPNSRNTLTLNASLYGGYDDNVLADQVGGGAGVDPRRAVQESGALAGASLALDYQRNGRRVDFGASINSAARYFPSEDELTSGDYGIGTGLTARLSPRTTLSLNQSASYQPFYQLSLFPGIAPPELGAGTPSNLDFVVNRDSGWLFNGGAVLDRRLSSRASLAFSYDFSRTDYDVSEATTDAPPRLNLNSQTAGVKYSRTVTRNAGFHLGYLYQRGSYDTSRLAPPPASVIIPVVPEALPPPPTGIAETHNIDVGVDYDRALGRERRTRVSFSTGSSIVGVDSDRHYRINGNAGLAHQMGRSWLASVQYNRGLSLVGNFAQPIFSDTVSLGLSGLVGERLQVTLGGGLAIGNIGFADTSDTDFKTYTGTASLQYALTSNLASYVQYTYFNYDFPTITTLPVTGKLERNGVRAGLSVTLPLLR